MPRRKSDAKPVYSPDSAIGYVRVSTDEQAAEGVSLDAQEARIRAYCIGAGLDLVQLVREEGVSGGKPLYDRPAGAELLGLLGAPRARHLVALKLDRLFRDAADALNRASEWDRRDVALHLVDMGGTAINTRSPMGRLMLTMMAAFAELERNMIGERTATALRHMRSSRQAYSPTPFGFVRDGDALVEHADELRVVAIIQDLELRGYSYEAIASHLNGAGIPAKRGGQWYRGSVRYVARNTALYGKVAA